MTTSACTRMSKILFITFVVAALIGCSSAFTTPMCHQQATMNTFGLSRSHGKAQQTKSVLFSSPEKPESSKSVADNNNNNNNDEAGVFSKFNSALDQPILDANNKEDQGPVINALKTFVRDDPDMASVTFSVAVVIFMAVATRGVMFVVNGF